MFREMRRNNKALSREDAVNMLEDTSFGTLAVKSVEGYPYSVPVSFVYDRDKIYFHSAKSGLKYESIAADSRVSFSAVAKDDVIPADFTTEFQSVILYGSCTEIFDAEEISHALNLIIEKYSKGFEKEGREYVQKHGPAAAVFRIDIEHITAKGV